MPKEISLGDSVIFEWNVSNAKTIILKPLNDTLDSSGTLVLKPKNDTTLYYKLTAISDKTRRSKSFSIKSISPKVKGAVPTSVTDEAEFMVNWNSSYADYVMISGCNEKLPVKGERKIRIDTAEKVIFTAYNQFGKIGIDTQKVRVKYIEYLRFPKEIDRGDSCLISWKYKKTKEVRIKGIDRKFNAIDSVFVKPHYPTHYKISAFRNNGDTTNQNASIKVLYPRLLSFAGPSYIFKGEEATLRWTSQFVPFVNIEGVKDSLPAIGKYIVKPAITTTYNLTTTVHREKLVLTACVNVLTRKLVVNSKSIKDVTDKVRFDFEIYATDFTDYPDSVRLYVLVVDTFGNFITDLAPPYGTKETSKKYFRTLVESSSANKRHKVPSFNVREVHEKNDIPSDINITMDYSGSMSGTTDKLEESCRLFINKKPDATRLAMVRFSDSITTLCGLTGDKKKLLRKAAFDPEKDTIYFGGTALYAAMDEGLRSLKNSPNPKQMFVFTDGYESSSFAYFGRRATFAQQIAKKAKNMNVRINSIGYGTATNEKVLKFLAILTGGSYYSLFRPSDLVNVMNEQLYLHNNYYMITYKPMHMEEEGTVSLVYNANNGKTGTANRDVFVGDEYDLIELESGGGNASWNTKNKWGNQSAVSLPQAVAKFDFAAVTLKPESYKKIEPFIKYLKNNPSSRIVVFGHADQIGNEEDCENLSKQRALSVKEYLIENGIPDSQIIIEPCGKKQPVWKTEDKPWKAAENRRVELLIIE